MNIFISFDAEADMGYIALTENRAGSAAQPMISAIRLWLQTLTAISG
ncbi:hypothetical protein [Bacillus paralicheniformis]|nr:hypothetical protein [Bacillus paralicheniformis]